MGLKKILCYSFIVIPLSILLAFLIYKLDILVLPVDDTTFNCTLLNNSYLTQPEDMLLFGNSLIFISHNKL